MSKSYLTPINLNGLELLNARLQQLASAPGSPTVGTIYYDTTLGYARVYSAAGWVAISTGTVYSDQNAQDAVGALITAGTQTGITVTYNSAAHTLSFSVAIDAAAGTASLRTLGTAGTQAAAGNDARLSDTRVPTDGTVTTAKIAAGGITPASITGTAVITSDSRLTDARTPTAGSVIDASITAGGLSPSKITGTAVVTADARLSDTRTPTAGSVVDASITAGGLSPSKITGTAVVTADSRLSDARNPIAGSVTDASVSGSAAISADKIASGTTNKVYTATEQTKLAGIATGATNYTDTNARANRLDQFAQPTASVNFNGQIATNAGTPVSSGDLVTKAYADGLRQGVSIKDPVRVATTAAGTLATSFANGQVVDGITLATGDRILIKNQAAPAENGIYTVNASGAPTRATDSDVAAEVSEGTTVWVQNGTAQINSRWVQTTAGAITLGTTGLTYTQDFQATTAQAGAGLTASGAVLAVGQGTGISVAADAVAIDTAVVTRKYNAAVGDGTSTSIVVTHGLGTQDVMVQVYRATTPWDQVEVDVQHTSTTTITLIFATAPTAGQFRVVVQG